MDFSYKTSYIPLLIIKIVKLSGEDGRSRAEQLLHMLRQIDQYVSSPVEYQRRRGCRAVYEMVLKFRMVCISGNCALGCHGSCTHSKQVDRTVHGNFSNLPCKIAYRESFQIICFFHYLMSFFFFFLLFNFQRHLFCQFVKHCAWEIGLSCIFHVVQTLIQKLEKFLLRLVIGRQLYWSQIS